MSRRMSKISIIILSLLMTLTGCASSLAVVDTNDLSEVNQNEVTTINSETTYDLFFSSDEIHEIYIDIAEEDFEDILLNPLEEAYHSANITLDGVTISNVGFRTKGNSTLNQVANTDSDRYSFKIKTNEYDNQDLLGLDEFVLNNMFSDASYLREFISYQAMADNGLNVPLSSFVNVYVNGQLYGFYLLVESVDDSFLERNFGDNDGNLYRADQGTTLAIENDQYIENVDQKNGDDESKEDLYALMTILNKMPIGEKGDIESILDVDSVLRYIATNTLLENYDSLNGKHQQNYYLYNDDGIFVLIPWDYNMSFGGFGGAGQSTIDIDNPISGLTQASPLIDNLLSVDEYREAYYTILNDYMDYFADFEIQVTELANMVRSSVENDPSKFTTMALFESNVVYQEGGPVEVASMNDMGKGDRPANAGAPPLGNTDQQGDARQGQNKDMVGQRPGNDKRATINAGSDVSIINLLMARIDNIKTQLAEK